jgi:predicted extracellular nuclease
MITNGTVGGLNGSAVATLMVASCNLLNLALPGRQFYPNQDPYTAEECRRKLDWLGAMVARLAADVIGFQEIWDESALKSVLDCSGLRLPHVLAPGAETGA